jgi:hypothetical protein
MIFSLEAPTYSPSCGEIYYSQHRQKSIRNTNRSQAPFIPYKITSNSSIFLPHSVVLARGGNVKV